MKKLLNKLKLINYNHINEWFPKTKNLLKHLYSHGNCILISQFNNIGDAVLISGVIKEIKEHYQLPLIIACNDFVSPIFKYNPYIDKIININPMDIKLSTLSEDSIFYIIDKIYNELWLNNLFVKEAFHFQCFEYNHVGMLFNYFSAAEKRIAYNQYSINKTELTIDEQNVLENNEYTNLFTTNIYQFPRKITHMVDRYYYLLEMYLNKKFNHDLYIYPQKTDITKYISKDKKNIVVNLGASIKSKQYPQKQLNTFLSKIDNENIILIGGKDVVNKYITCNHIDLINRTSLIESIDLINNCDLYIGNDTGLTHIAAACKKPSLVFYKESIDSFQYFPERLSSYLQFKPYKTKCICLRPEKRLNPCSKRKNIYNGCMISDQHHCIRQITIEEIEKSYYSLTNEY